MSNGNSIDKDRKVLPLWRHATDAPIIEHLSAHIRPPLHPPNNKEVETAHRSFERNPTPQRAVEILDAANFGFHTSQVKDAANFLLQNSNGISATLVQRAEAILSSATSKSDFGPSRHSTTANIGDLTSAAKAKHRQISLRLKNNAHNPFDWLELARVAVSLGAPIGEDTKPRRYIQIALGLASNNRFVLRSAARFFMHNQEPDLGLKLIRKSPATRNDPWLIASEVGISSSIGLPNLYGKRGFDLLRNNSINTSSHIAELAAAIASEEFANGATKRARKLFILASKYPTENAAAQVVWAETKHDFGIETEGLIRVPRSFEARVRDGLFREEFSELLKNCHYWQNDEPYSAEPSIHGSHYAISFLEDYDAAALFARRGLFSHPKSFTLRNNLVVALARSGKLTEAVNEFNRIATSHLSTQERVTYIATEGLLYFRKGQADKGRSSYIYAIELAKKEKSPTLVLWATLHVINEEVAADIGNAGTALETLEVLEKKVDRKRHLYSVASRKLLSHLRAKITSKRAKNAKENRATPEQKVNYLQTLELE